MFTDTITYEDFNGQTQEKKIYFNLSRMDAIRLESSFPGGFTEYLQKTMDSGDLADAIVAFEKIAEASYGVKSEDGQRFIKNEEVWTEFKESPAYDEFMTKLMTDEDYTLNFVIGAISSTDETPDQIKAKVAERLADKGLTVISND